MDVVCAYCQAPLKRPPSRVKACPRQYCDAKCMGLDRQRPLTAPCVICGTPITAKASRITTARAHTCGPTCLAALRARNRVDYWESGARRQTTCAYCGRPILRKPSQVAKYTAHYCNRACHAAAKVGHLVTPNTGRWYPCETCGEDVWRTPATLEPHVFCSRKCARAALPEPALGHLGQRGATSPRWRGGRKTMPYTEGWGRWRSKEVRDRDGNACRACGNTEGLLVHHIDMDKVDHSDANLITLCRPCHAAVHNGRLSLD